MTERSENAGERRLRRLADRQRAAGVDCVILVPGPNMRYLSGLELFMSERPVVIFYPLDKRPAVLVPALEMGRAKATVARGADLYPYSDEEGYENTFEAVADALALNGKRCAVEHLAMRVLELRALERAAPTAQFLSLEEMLPGLRVIKDESELDAMRQAIAITEQALGNLATMSLLGMTEREIAARLKQEMIDAGADAIAFIIVVAGPNSADPHAGPSNRVVRAGDLLAIDCGALKDGYPSDITRTFFFAKASPELSDIYHTVLRANEAARQAGGPGIPAQDVDRAARRVIADAGYGEYFIHRTGHGLGLMVHEPPYIVEGNEQLLEPGMVFTIEPGIYVPGVGGVRIEDNVVVTENGLNCLTTFSRELTVIS